MPEVDVTEQTEQPQPLRYHAVSLVIPDNLSLTEELRKVQRRLAAQQSRIEQLERVVAQLESERRGKLGYSG